MRKVVSLLLIALLAPLFAGCASTSPERNEYFSDWPAGTSPAEIGKRVAENFAPRKFRWETVPEKASLGIIYPEAITWYGSLTVAQLTHDTNLTARLIEKLEPYLSEPLSQKVNHTAHVDYRVFGIVPLQVYLEDKDKRCLDLGLSLADAQWSKTTPDGITAEARYWIDDMYMIPAVQTQAYRATGEMKYLDRAALTMSVYLDRLQQPNGLFFHGTNAPFYWSRGNGWMAAGMAELLRSLPADHPRRERIMAGYKEMMAALLKYQGDDGLWHQLIDHPESWPETSGTGMFTFSMITGVKNGWLDAKTYGPAARKAWLGLVSKLDKDANVADVCAGTNKGDNLDFYLNRPRLVGDLHGQAPILWSATALLR